MRIAKCPPLTGVAFDFHQAVPPISPPVPPSPAPIPTYKWIHTFVSHLMAMFVTGKYAKARVTTEVMGDILWQYDWGPTQLHIPLPPISTPSILLLALTSQVKFFLPAFAVKEPVDGAFTAGETPVAIATPAWLIPVQTCQDLAGWGFVAPFGICFVVPSTRHVGVTLGDVLAGFIGMAGDALGNLVLSGIGSGLGIPNNIRGCLTGAGLNALYSGLNIGIGTLSSDGQMYVSMILGTGFGPFGVPVLISYGAGLAANAVGDAWQPPPPPGS